MDVSWKSQKVVWWFWGTRVHRHQNTLFWLLHPNTGVHREDSSDRSLGISEDEQSCFQLNRDCSTHRFGIEVYVTVDIHQSISFASPFSLKVPDRIFAPVCETLYHGGVLHISVPSKPFPPLSAKTNHHNNFLLLLKPLWGRKPAIVGLCLD